MMLAWILFINLNSHADVPVAPRSFEATVRIADRDEPLLIESDRDEIRFRRALFPNFNAIENRFPARAFGLSVDEVFTLNGQIFALAENLRDPRRARVLVRVDLALLPTTYMGEFRVWASLGLVGVASAAVAVTDRLENALDIGLFVMGVPTAIAIAHLLYENRHDVARAWRGGARALKHGVMGTPFALERDPASGVIKDLSLRYFDGTHRRVGRLSYLVKAKSNINCEEELNALTAPNK